MKLHTTKDEHRGEIHSGPLFPGASERQFAYQGERVMSRVRLEVHGWPAARSAGKLNHGMEEPDYDKWELVIEGFTGTAISVRLIGYRRMEKQIEDRRRTGRAVVSDELQKTMQFGELCNFLFDGASVYHETESFPPIVAEAMRRAYPTEGDSSKFQVQSSKFEGNGADGTDGTNKGTPQPQNRKAQEMPSGEQWTMSVVRAAADYVNSFRDVGGGRVPPPYIPESDLGAVYEMLVAAERKKILEEQSQGGDAAPPYHA